MSYDFSAEEILKMAEEIERNGVNFYTAAAEQITDPAYKKLLLDLAAMEIEHEKVFASMRTELTEKEKEAPIFDPAGEAELYLRALADTRVFFKKEMDTSSMKEILKAGIAAEKDSIIFYLGMKDAVPENLGKKRIDAILKEEMRHIRLLSKELIGLK